jgi:anti-sigma factor RsiW
MPERCPTSFDQALISGFMDNELTQAAEQRVRLHLEDCAHCRALHEELKTLREATMTTRFAQPADSEWDERPRSTISRASRGLGWTLAVVWLVATICFGLWQMWIAPQSMFERLLVFGGISAFALLFVSVLLDRIRAAKSDRYREVDK